MPWVWSARIALHATSARADRPEAVRHDPRRSVARSKKILFNATLWARGTARGIKRKRRQI